MKSWIRCLSFVMTVAAMAPAARATNEVFRVNVAMQGRLQSKDIHGKPVLTSRPVQNDTLINLATGNAFNAAVPNNLVLAATVTCGAGISELVVWDTSNSSNLVVIATLNTNVVLQASNAVIQAKTKAEFVGILNMNSVGNDGNGITNGLLVATGKATITTNDLCPTKITATLSGILDVTTTDDIAGTNSFTILVPKGTLTTQGPPLQ